MINIDVDEIAEALEMVNESSTAYLNLDSGEIVWLSDFMDSAEAEEVADRIECGNFERLPAQYEINEYEMMENFIQRISETKIRNDLMSVISGRGAFRRFKNSIRFYGIEYEWYEFRDKAYRKFAENWLKALKEKSTNKITINS